MQWGGGALGVGGESQSEQVSFEQWFQSGQRSALMQCKWEGVPEFRSCHAKRPATHGAETGSGGGKEVDFSGA